MAVLSRGFLCFVQNAEYSFQINNPPLNALYEILKAALLFYKKLARDLIGIGSKLNPYDPCVANKIVNGKQMTLCWHVDDMKISHYQTQKVDDFVKWLRMMYEHLFPDGSGV
jgi:hypothetical protein